jgi:pimeloyl-ACP methyl ester carboxylesterase
MRLINISIKTNTYIVFCALVFSLTASVCHAQSDYAREKRWADEITPAILSGDPIYLALKSGHKFLAIHTPNTKARAGVIVVHGAGLHPDWGLNNPLRTQLSEQGYVTLSVQMPVLAAEIKGDSYSPLLPEAAERLRIAVAFLREKGHKKIAIVSHSVGSRMVNEFLARGGAIDAWVSIGINTGVYDQPEVIKIPVLDIFGEKDFPAVMQYAGRRAEAIKRVRGSAQIEVAGTDHFFVGAETQLVQHVKRFLDRAIR